VNGDYRNRIVRGVVNSGDSIVNVSCVVLKSALNHVTVKFWIMQQASPGWAIRFCKRHPELLQRSPTLDTVLPGCLLQKVEKFRCDVQQTVQDMNLTLGCVGNMDELYLSFSTLVSGRRMMKAERSMHFVIIIIIVIIYFYMSSLFKASYAVNLAVVYIPWLPL
jgi:hypothetical protein